jgi:hypothetical protein
MLANHLATYANGDGTSITAGVARFVRETGMSRSTMFRRLDDLSTLGVLNRHGLTGERGTARRSIDTSKLKLPGEAEVSEVSDSGTEVSDSQSRSLE